MNRLVHTNSTEPNGGFVSLREDYDEDAWAGWTGADDYEGTTK